MSNYSRGSKHSEAIKRGIKRRRLSSPDFLNILSRIETICLDTETDLSERIEMIEAICRIEIAKETGIKDLGFD